VWFLNHPDNVRMQAMRRFRDGSHAAVGELSSKMVHFDRWGELVGEYSALWFEGRTRFVHDWINAHDVIEIEDGRWEGALAIITSTEDELSTGETVLGEGIIVYDPFEDEVLWDWHSHGELGDDVPIDPKIDHGYVGQFWMHGNAFFHTVEDDGAESFWISARDMNWILKIDVDTDGVVWRLGKGGDFQLVDDLDADDPQPVENAAWYYKQHAPEITKRFGDRAQLLVFDNRSNLGDWSRVVGLEIDESTFRAQIIFEYGDEDPDSPEHFFSSIAGDADLMPGGESVVVADSRDDIALFEVGYPEGGERWRMECTGQKEMYRVTYRTSIYD
jgi:Arylsulfotransferase (ASST)